VPRATALDRLTALSRPAPLLLITLILRGSVVFLRQFFSGDEAIYAALAVRMLHGHLLYAGAVDHKPPGVSVLYAAVFFVAGQNHLAAVRTVLILVVWATAVVVGRIGATLAGSGATMAGLLYTCASAAGEPRDAMAANTELFLNLPIALAALLVARRYAAAHGGASAGTLSGRAGALFLAGALTALGGLFKYQSSLAGIAWVAALLASERFSARLASGLAALAAGFLLVAAGVCGFFYLRGAWDPFVFWAWQYNFSYIGALSSHDVLRNFLKGTPEMALFWSPLLGLAAVAIAARRVDFLTAAWLAAMCLAITVGGRYFRFYHLMALPALSIAAAAGAIVLAERRSRWGRLAAGLLAASVIVSAVFPWIWWKVQPAFEREHETLLAVGDYIRTHSAPGARLFVWGNSPQIYAFADREMATRFVFCNYHIGKIWGSWAWDVDAGDTSQYVVPRAWTELLEDLDRAPPDLIVDGGAGRLANFDRHPISRYPQLAARLKGYRLEAVIAGVPVYRRIGG